MAGKMSSVLSQEDSSAEKQRFRLCSLSVSAMVNLPEFWLRPYDAPRPHHNPPRADFRAGLRGKTYYGRSVNGLLYFREEERFSSEWDFAVGEPIPREADLVSFFTEQMGQGNIARVVLLPFKGEFFKREFPLFLKPDGTGFCRESWNQDDVAFAHDLSLHEWLEAPASSLFSFCDELFRREIAPLLEMLSLPPNRNVPLMFGRGSRADLNEVVSHIVALEPSLTAGGSKIVRVTCQTESPFARAGFYEVSGEGGRIETWFEPQTGQRFRLPWKQPTLDISQRFWTLCDWAIDWLTPTGMYWDYHDRGQGRLSESPHSRDFSLQFIVAKLPPADESRVFLRNWAVKLWPVELVDEVLNDDQIAQFEPRENAP